MCEFMLYVREIARSDWHESVPGQAGQTLTGATKIWPQVPEEVSVS